jgi:hypothetical protein
MKRAGYVSRFMTYNKLTQHFGLEARKEKNIHLGGLGIDVTTKCYAVRCEDIH